MTQAGEPCTYTLDAGGRVGAGDGDDRDGGRGGAGRAAPGRRRSSAPWVTITSGATGSGNGTVGYSVAANPADEFADGDADDRRPVVHHHPGRCAVHVYGEPGDAVVPCERRPRHGHDDGAGRLRLDARRPARPGSRSAAPATGTRQRDVRLHRRRQCRSPTAAQRDDCGRPARS